MSAPAILLIHGAWHDSRCWDSLTPILESRGRQVLRPDLPSHGADTTAAGKVTLRHYAAAITNFLETAEAPVLLVAHSMAGVPATMAACARPDKVARIAYLCAYLPRPGDSVFSLMAEVRGHEPLLPIELAMELSADKRFCQLDRNQAPALFYSDLPSDQAAAHAAQLGPQGSLPLSGAARFDQPTFENLASTYICCTRDRVLPLHLQRRMLNRQPVKDLLQQDFDHSPFHSAPRELAELLLAMD